MFASDAPPPLAHGRPPLLFFCLGRCCRYAMLCTLPHRPLAGSMAPSSPSLRARLVSSRLPPRNDGGRAALSPPPCSRHGLPARPPSPPPLTCISPPPSIPPSPPLSSPVARAVRPLLDPAPLTLGAAAVTGPHHPPLLTSRLSAVAMLLLLVSWRRVAAVARVMAPVALPVRRLGPPMRRRVVAIGPARGWPCAASS